MKLIWFSLRLCVSAVIMAWSAAAQIPTNNIAPSAVAVITDTNGNLIAPTNLFSKNAAQLNAAVVIPPNTNHVAGTFYPQTPVNEVAGAYNVEYRLGEPAYLDGRGSNTTQEISRIGYYTTPAGLTNLSLLYEQYQPTTNIGNANGLNGIQLTIAHLPTLTIGAAIEYPSNTFYYLTFGGNQTGSCLSNNYLLSDNLNLTIPPNTPFWVRTFVSVPSAPAAYAASLNTSFTETNSDLLGPAITNIFKGGSIVSSNGFTYNSITNVFTFGNGYFSYTPSAVLGNYPGISFGLIGDSITKYNTTAAASNDVYFSGFWAAAIQTNYPTVTMNYYGNFISSEASNNCNHIATITNAVNVVVCELGINDLDGGATFAQMTNYYLTAWNTWAAGGRKVYQTTIMPHSYTTDNWATVSNQTDAIGAVRIQVNQWLRTCPAPLSGYFDLADITESARNSGLWQANGTAFGYTRDGLHPSIYAAALYAASISNWVQQIVSNQVPGNVAVTNVLGTFSTTGNVALATGPNAGFVLVGPNGNPMTTFYRSNQTAHLNTSALDSNLPAFLGPVTAYGTVSGTSFVTTSYATGAGFGLGVPGNGMYYDSGLMAIGENGADDMFFGSVAGSPAHSVIINGGLYGNGNTQNIGTAGSAYDNFGWVYAQYGFGTIGSVSAATAVFTNSLTLMTNAAFPASVSKGGMFATSNYDLYWITPTKTNLVVLGH
jgi:hypothetical protein